MGMHSMPRTVWSVMAEYMGTFEDACKHQFELIPPPSSLQDLWQGMRLVGNWHSPAAAALRQGCRDNNERRRGNNDQMSRLLHWWKDLSDSPKKWLEDPRYAHSLIKQYPVPTTKNDLSLSEEEVTLLVLPPSKAFGPTRGGRGLDITVWITTHRLVVEQRLQQRRRDHIDQNLVREWPWSMISKIALAVPFHEFSITTTIDDSPSLPGTTSSLVYTGAPTTTTQAMLMMDDNDKYVIINYAFHTYQRAQRSKEANDRPGCKLSEHASLETHKTALRK